MARSRLPESRTQTMAKAEFNETAAAPKSSAIGRASRNLARYGLIGAAIIFGGGLVTVFLHETGLSRGDFTLIAGTMLGIVLALMAYDMRRNS